MILFAFMGASGSGKSTLQHSLPIKFLTNYTTRELRKGEIDGYHIKHVTFDEFNKLERQGRIFEKNFYSGNYYGTPTESIKDLLENGTPYHATVDINGATKLKESLGKDRVRVIYVKTCTINELKFRMQLRGDDPLKIEQRLKYIEEIDELSNEKYADYILLNDDLHRAKIEMMSYVIKELVNKITIKT